MKLLNQDWTFLREQRENGYYVGLPYDGIHYKQTDLTEKVRILLQENQCPHIAKEDEEAEGLLDDISSFVTETELRSDWLDMPSDGEDEYFLQVSSNVIVYISAGDTYEGRGESETWSAVKGLIITEEVTNREVFDFIKWMKTLNGEEVNE